MGELAGVAASLFASYRSTRVAISLDRLRLGLPARLPQGAPAVDQATLDAVNPDVLPWVPNELTLGGVDWCWGSAPVRRVAAVLITWINTVAAAAPPEVAASLYAVKEKVGGTRSRADRISPSAGIFEELFAEELRREGVSVADAFEAASRRWPSDDAAAAATAIAALNDQLALLATHFGEFVALARSTIDQPLAEHTDPKPFAALRGLVRLHDGAAGELTRLLLCIEVVEATFSGTEPRPDQEIRLVQFTSKGAVTIDTLGRSAPIDKLAGVELAHFGAFLKRSWRANDWMWGRLDAAERLVRLLDALLDNRLTEQGTLERHTRAIQAAILREELPTVVGEIERDHELGGRVSDEGRAFCTAVRSATSQPDGPVDLSLMNEGQIKELFALQLVGSENLEMEVGSNLATLTSIAALATTAGVMRAQGPRLLRGPSGSSGSRRRSPGASPVAAGAGSSGSSKGHWW